MRLAAHPGNTRLFLDALTALGLAEKKQGRYANTPLADRYLRRGSPTYLGGLAGNLKGMEHRNLPRLTELLKSGPPPVARENRLDGEAQWTRSARDLACYQKAGMADFAADLVYAKDLQAFLGRVLDALNPGGVFISLHEGLIDERTGPEAYILSRLSFALEGQDVSFEAGQIAEAGPSFAAAAGDIRVSGPAVAETLPLLAMGRANVLPGISRTVTFTPWNSPDQLRAMLTSVPGVVTVMLGMLWLGLGSAMVVAIVALMVAPTIHVAVIEGLATVDATLSEMARAYRFTPAMRLWHVYAPAMAAPLFSGGVAALGMAMRVAVLAEALGANEGVGHALSVARTNLDTPQLYALALLSMLLVGLAEMALSGLARRTIGRRRS